MVWKLNIGWLKPLSGEPTHKVAPAQVTNLIVPEKNILTF
jgi:hypothetical protein